MNDVQFHKLIGEFENMLEKEFRPLRERVDRIDGDRRDRRSARKVGVNMKERKVYGDSESYMGWHDDRRYGGSRGYKSKGVDSLGGAKVIFPSFYGKSDPKEYIEWEERMKIIFENQHYSEVERVRRACSKLSDYAKTWWDKLVLGRKRCLEDPIVTWGEMKRVMRKHFVSAHHDMRSGRRDSYEDFCGSMRRPIRKEKIDARPMMESSRGILKHGYQGTPKTLNSCTYDIQCWWCLELGHDISNCPKEDVMVVKEKDVIVVEVESVVEKVEKVENKDFSPFEVECIELYAVEGEFLDGVVHNVFVEEDEHVCDSMVDVCPTSEFCGEFEEVEVEETLLCGDASIVHDISLVQLNPKEFLEDKLKFQKVSDMAERKSEGKSEMAIEKKEIEKKNKYEVVERKSDDKSEMTIERKKEWKENEWKETKKKNVMVQISEAESCFILYKSLQVPLYEEIYSHCHDIAGSIPSIVISYLQDCGGVVTSRQRDINGGEVQLFESWGIKSNQDEVRIVVSETTRRYVLSPYFDPMMLCFQKCGKRVVNTLFEKHDSMFTLVSKFHEYESREKLHALNLNVVNFEFSQVGRLIGIDGIQDHVNWDHLAYALYDELFGITCNKHLRLSDMLRNCMDDMCGMFYLHDFKLFDVACQEVIDGCSNFYVHDVYLFKENKFFTLLTSLHKFLLWLHMKRFVNLTCGRVVAFRLGESILHDWKVFLIPCDQLLYICMIFSLGLTRSKKGRNLIFVILNEICLLLLHASILTFNLKVWIFVLHDVWSLQGHEFDRNLEVNMAFRAVRMLMREDYYPYEVHEQGKCDFNNNFCVANLLRFCVDEGQDLRTNLFEEGEYDAKSIMSNELFPRGDCKALQGFILEYQRKPFVMHSRIEDDAIVEATKKAWEPLELPPGPITRGRSKMFEKALLGVILSIPDASRTLI